MDELKPCNHEFVYDELHHQIVCKKCFHVLTAEEKRESLHHAFELMMEEEQYGKND